MVRTTSCQTARNGGPQPLVNIQVHASASSTSTPLQAESIGLASAANIASQLNIVHATFLSDCLTLAKCVVLANTLDPSIPWNIRKDLTTFFKHFAALNPKVFHISREVNGVARNLAHRVFRSNRDTQICCFSRNHSSTSSLLSNLQIPGVKIHTMHYY
ncbi:hypothetical protein ZWY2020_040057 [Hordeum vulgare]|nr:hypothetical protein ZWY2020_040057 [Hordeum vulgare]